MNLLYYIRFTKHRKRTALRFFSAAALALCLLLSGCGAEKTVRASFFSMDTYMTLEAAGPQAEAALQAVQAEIQRLDRLLSIQGADSEIAALHDGGGTVSRETADLLETALSLSAAVDGAYDCTVAPVMALWGWYGGDPAVPAQDALARALALTDYRAVTVEGQHVSFAMDGMAVDLGGIAKGYAAGRAAEVLRDHGVTSALLSLGGNIRAVGSKPDGSDWSIGIADPAAPARYLATLAVSDCAVVTSGGYNRYFEENGRRWHHILDPATGYPAESGLASVTIVSRDDALADGLSTALFVMGLEEAAAFWRSGVYDFEAVFITTDGEIFATGGLEGRLSCEAAVTFVAP